MNARLEMPAYVSGGSNGEKSLFAEELVARSDLSLQADAAAMKSFGLGRLQAAPEGWRSRA